MHRNQDDAAATVCKKQITYGSGKNALTDAECIRRLKQWLLKGLEIDATSPNARQTHVYKMDPRKFRDLSDIELEAWLARV